MCGVLGVRDVKGVPDWAQRAQAGLAAIEHRGPDASRLVRYGDWLLGHNRLAILDLDERSNQPFEFGQYLFSYNGELWNYREIRKGLEDDFGVRFRTEGDTEVVAAAIATLGPGAALPMMEGMFAVAWTDGDTLWAARDRFGEVPLHFYAGRPFAVASELKALRAMNLCSGLVRAVTPGKWYEIRKDSWEVTTYYSPRWSPADPPRTRAEAAQHLALLLRQACQERAISDVPVCALLSGGVDSAVIVAALSEKIPHVVCYHAVFDRSSPDLRSARAIAGFLGLELREVEVPRPTAMDVRRVVETIELPFKAQVEIGWPCLVVAERMRADGFKVTFSGEGADELLGSYEFAHRAIREGKDFRQYRLGLFAGQERKNFPRCNKAFLSQGVEARLPFLHTPLVEYLLSLPTEIIRDAKDGPSTRKQVLRDAAGLWLPPDLIPRTKYAFQDGMGIKPEFERLIEKGLMPSRASYDALFTRLFWGAPA